MILLERIVKSKGKSSQNNWRKTKCFRCGEQGHVVNSCSFQSNMCYNFKKPGHLSSKCPLKKQAFVVQGTSGKLHVEIAEGVRRLELELNLDRKLSLVLELGLGLDRNCADSGGDNLETVIGKYC